MNVKQLINNYPGTRIDKNPFQPDKNTLYFHEYPYYLAIPEKNLSDRERILLKTLLSQEMPPDFSERGRYWYNLLIKGRPFKKEAHARKARFIQFQLASRLSNSELIEWRKALEAFFDSTSSFIYLSSRKGIIIEEALSIAEEDLVAIANTLANDFSVKCYFQIGLRYTVSPLLRSIFTEENQLFERMMAGSSTKEVTSVEAGFFSLLVPIICEWKILDEVRMMIAEDGAWIAIIRAIWAYQGNISLAAKHLYMHRNTLQYRMDRFYERTGVSLKKMDGLTFAYLTLL